MKKKSELAFDKYISNYDKSVKQIRFKYFHSYRVEKLMKKLAIALGLSKEEVKIAELIGLLHDIGRFEQIKKYGDCSDVKTGIDHADESCIYLFDNNHIRDFIEDDKYDSIIEDAIKYHNKIKIDDSIVGKNLLFSKMIRDMDKVDIYRVLSEEYSFIFNKDDVTSKVYETFNNHKTIDSHDKKTETDQVYAHLAFVYDINFKESFEILKQTNYLNDYFKSIRLKNDNEREYIENDKAFNELIDEINSFIKNNS